MSNFTRYYTPQGYGAAVHPCGKLYRREEVDAYIEQLEARVSAADKLAERARRTIDGYGFTADGNDTWREVAAVDLAELDTALAAYEATKEQSNGNTKC